MISPTSVNCLDSNLKTIQKRKFFSYYRGEKSNEVVVGIFVIFMIAKEGMITKEKDNHGSINSKVQTQVY